MNTKMEFVKKAAEIALEEQTFMWIDFGILKIMKNPERVITMLQEIQQKTFTKFTIPGCWSYGPSSSSANLPLLNTIVKSTFVSLLIS